MSSVKDIKDIMIHTGVSEETANKFLIDNENNVEKAIVEASNFQYLENEKRLIKRCSLKQRELAYVEKRLRQLKSKISNGDKPCPVCLEDKHFDRIQSCGHFCCEDCVNKLKRKCPICRRKINLIKFHI